MKILIVTGIYPPNIGGPAQYAKNLYTIFSSQGHRVRVSVFNRFQKYPWGVRHVMFFFHIIPAILWSDYVCALDPFMSGVAAIFGKLLGKKTVLRLGGDLLWESYLERTHDKVLFRDFYKTRVGRFNLKEKVIFYLLGWALRNQSAIIWSTKWQENISLEPYKLQKQKHFVIENYYGQKEFAKESQDEKKVFVASSRGIFLKNEDLLRSVFSGIKEADLFSERLPFNEFMEKIKNARGVIAASFSEVSPNIILDAIRFNRPFICTREVGIYDRIKDAGTFIDPLDKESLSRAVRHLLSEEGYKEAVDKVSRFNFTHSWEDIAQEFLKVFKSIQK